MTQTIKPKRNLEIRADFSYALRGKTYTVVKVLAANTAASLTVPSGVSVAFFSADGNFWADYDQGTITVPGGDITDGSAPELNPGVRLVGDVTTINLISLAGCNVSIMFFLA